MKQSLFRMIAVCGVVAAVAACDDASPVQPTGSVLAGLDVAASNDSAPSQNPTTPSGPGYFHGTVLGPSQPGAGNDSLATAPRIAGVVVTIYERVAASGGEAVGVGDAKGSVTTGADGKFTLPTLPAGEYVVTFVPPASSQYHGAYAFGPLNQNSSTYPWWVVLARK